MSSMLPAQQVLVNKVWDVSFGNPGPIDWSATTVDPAGNLITTGNTVVSGTQIAAMLSKQDQQGNILWQQNFTIAPNSQNYGFAVCTDQSGYIYVAGACQTGLVNRDVLVLKYDPSGGLVWSQTYNSTNQQDDGAVAITCDPNGGQIFVTGPSMGSLTQFDYLTLALDGANGTVIWNQRYNGPSSLPDVPIGITFDNGDVNIIGASGANTNQYDVTTLRYSYTGSLVDSVRYSLAGTKIDQPTAITKDLAGNLYITGSSTTNGTNYDLQTMKINASDLSIAWVKTYDQNGLEDKATSVCVNAQGEVFVTGYVTLQTGKTVMTAIKYAANSTQEWVVRLAENEDFARGQRCALDNLGNLSLTGVSLTNGASTWLTYQLEPSQGNVLFERKLQSGNNLDFQPNDIRWVNSDGFVVSGRSASGYRSVYYERLITEDEIFYDSLNQPVCMDYQLIVKFRPYLLNPGVINDLGRQYAKLDELLPASISSAPNYSNVLRYVYATKVFDNMTMADSILLTRTGETMHVDSLWAYFVIVSKDNEFDLTTLTSAFGDIPIFVENKGLNYVASQMDTPNDPFYPSQLGLDDQINSGLANQHINVSPAWDLSCGKPSIKVGIYDRFVMRHHEDFFNPSTGFTRIGYRSNYASDLNFDQFVSGILNNDDCLFNDHGTAVAGIIGANRDNSIGISGIAGGSSDPIKGSGVTLATANIFPVMCDGPSSPSSVAISKIAKAVKDGARPNVDGKEIWGLDIKNYSWGIENPIQDIDDGDLLTDAFYFSFKSGCINVCARGNSGTNHYAYPATFSDDWVISVGASNIFGSRVFISEDNIQYGTTLTNGASSYGSDLDIIAPGVQELVLTTRHNGAIGNDVFGNPNYKRFDGTSAAAPFVSGVAALMLSYKPDDFATTLFPEDVENLIEYYATDVNDPNDPITNHVGYDQATGWGLLNAGSALNGMKSPEFKLFQNTVEGFDINLDEFYLNDCSSLEYENYTIKKHFVLTLPSNFEVLDVWSRGSSNLCNTQQFCSKPNYNGISDLTFDVFNNEKNKVEIDITAHIIKQLNNNTWTVQKEDIILPYTVYVKNTNFSNLEELSNSKEFNLFPVPANRELNIELTVKSAECSYAIFNSIGQLIKRDKIGLGTQFHIVNIEDLAEGLYYISIYDSGVNYSKPFTIKR